MCPSPAGISQQALQAFTSDTFLHELQWRMKSSADLLDLEQVANGVVHSVTKETITRYKKLIEDTILRAVWMKTMTTELGQLAQGYKDTDGTNTIECMDLDGIAKKSKRKHCYVRAHCCRLSPTEKKTKIECETPLGEISSITLLSLPHA